MTRKRHPVSNELKGFDSGAIITYRDDNIIIIIVENPFM
jgi:hypothetical protein